MRGENGAQWLACAPADVVEDVLAKIFTILGFESNSGGFG